MALSSQIVTTVYVLYSKHQTTINQSTKNNEKAIHSNIISNVCYGFKLVQL